MEDYLSKLNPQQRDAVIYDQGPQLVIAGAGSGKTRVLTYKIVHLLAHGFEPWRILALTFTNKAAAEMRERITSVVGHDVASRLWMGTFHSIFARILRSNAERIGFRRDFTIYDASDSKSLIKTIIKDMQLDDKVYKPTTVQNAISMAKNALISPSDYANDRDLMEADRRAKRPLTAAIYKAYRSRCVVAGAMDFDDLLYFTNVLLRDNPDVLNHYREFFRFVLVDEYQDTNFAQHLIVSRLTSGTGNMMVVGDDAQSIYSFRGANIRNILNLRNSYPDLRIFKLEQNYRSTRNIIEAANSLIEKNTEQIRKHIFSEGEKGNPVEVVQSYSDYEESFLVANRVSQLKLTGHDSYDDFAILYRTNAQSRVLEESLRKRNIPYRIFGGLSFYQRKEIKDAIAYFRLSVNPDDDEALRRVINFPARGIGETTVNRIIRAAIDNNVSMWQVISDPARFNPGYNSAAARKIEAFRSLIQSFIELNEKATPADAVATAIINATALLSSLMSDTTPESISKQENLQELLNGVKEFTDSRIEEGRADQARLIDFLAEVSLATDQDTVDSSGEAVTLMTIHASKGLEFTNVFVVGVEEDLLPSSMANGTLSEIEEERRLLYVAITRAKRYCMLSYATSRFKNGEPKVCTASRFLRDIDPKFLRLATGSSLGSGGERMTNPMDNYRSSWSSTPRRSSTTSSQWSAVRHPLNSPSSSSPSAPTSTSSPRTPSSSEGFSLFSAADLRVGMRVEHPRFGDGVIMSIDTSNADPRITVRFSNVDTKVLLLKFARLKIISK